MPQITLPKLGAGVTRLILAAFLSTSLSGCNFVESVEKKIAAGAFGSKSIEESKKIDTPPGKPIIPVQPLG